VEVLETRTLLSGSPPIHPGFFHPSFSIPLPGQGVRQPNDGPGGGYTPAQILGAYGIGQVKFSGGTITGDGTGQTIAVVDAYDDPNIVNDLGKFDTYYYGSNAPPVSSFFTKVAQDGSTNYPGVDSGGGWELEESLDVEWAHAIAPGAKILLVEATTSNDSDINTAIDYARHQNEVSVVSMSFGESEYPGETSIDALFKTVSGHTVGGKPGGTTFVSSSGDSGAPVSYQAASPNVLAVGGTTLFVTSSNTWSSETGWSGSGGGISAYEAQPAYQSGVVSAYSTTKRTNPDVAFDADPNHGASVYDSYPYGGYVYHWLGVGGTSFSAPAWAGIMAIINQGLVLNGKGTLDGATQTLPAIYKLPASDFHDIVTGTSTGSPHYSAGPGYDLVTGFGSPIANLLIPDMVNGQGGGGSGGTDTWTGKGPDNKWSDPQNWFALVAPVAGDNVVFGPGASQLTSNNDLAAGTAFGSITLSSAGYVISGNAVALSGGIDASIATGANAFNLSVTLANAAETFKIGGSSTTVTFGGAINTNTFTLAVAGGTGTGVFSGIISGTGGMTFNDTGTITYAGTAANSYTGTTAVNGGTLVLNDSAGGAIVAALTVGSGSGSQLVQLAAGNQLTAAVGVTVNSSGKLDLNNNSTPIGALTLSAGTVTTGTGTLTLGGNIASSGASSISGSLGLGASTWTITVASNATLTISAVISGTGGLTNAGKGTLVLSGANTYSGTTTQTLGTLTVGSNTALGTGAFAFNAGTITATGGPVTLANAVTLGGNVTFAGTNNLTFTGAATLTGNRTLTVTNTGTTTFSGNIGQAGGARSLTEGGAGLFVLSGNNTFSGGASIVMGLVGVGSNTAFGTGQLGVRYSTLNTTGANVTLANNVMTNGDDVTFAGSQSFTFTGNWTFAYDRSIIVNNPQVLISGTIKQTSSGTKFTKDGPGVLVFAGACTYTDATIITAGTLLVTGSIGAASGITVNSGGTLAGSGIVGAVTVNTGGTVFPGTNATTTGMLTTGAITFNTGAAFNVTLNGNAPGTGYDQLSSSSITLGGSTLNVTLGFTPTVGTSFTIIHNSGNASVSGTFNGLAEGATFAVGTETFQITYQGGVSLRDVVITRIA
jgi:autotransporter-associated beta strand protein